MAGECVRYPPTHVNHLHYTFQLISLMYWVCGSHFQVLLYVVCHVFVPITMTMLIDMSLYPLP